MYIVLYNAGAAGDLVSALIDNTDYRFSRLNKFVSQIYNLPGSDRENLIQLHASIDPKNFYFNSESKEKYFSFVKYLETKYKAITSHWFEVLGYTDYPKILIDDSDGNWYKVTARRFNYINAQFGNQGKNHIITPMEMRLRKVRIENYKSDYKDNMLIKFQDIVEGKLVDRLSQYVDIENPNLYTWWLEKYHKDAHKFT